MIGLEEEPADDGDELLATLLSEALHDVEKEAVGRCVPALPPPEAVSILDKVKRQFLGMHQVLKPYVLRHIHKHFPVAEHFYALKVPPGTLATTTSIMSSLLRPAALEIVVTDGLDGEHRVRVETTADVQTAIADTTATPVPDKLFFRLLKRTPKRNIRQHVAGELGFDTFDYVITPHDVMRWDKTNQQMIVKLDSTKPETRLEHQNLVLSLNAMNLDQLLDMWVFTRGKEVHYLVDEAKTEVPVPEECSETLPELVRTIFQNHQGQATVEKDPKYDAALQYLLDTDVLQVA